MCKRSSRNCSTSRTSRASSARPRLHARGLRTDAPRRQRRGTGQPRPSSRLDKLTASGKVVGERAELSLHFTIYVDDKDWVRVPLRLTGCVMCGEAKYEGPGDHMVEFDDASDEYVVWLRGASDKPHVSRSTCSLRLRRWPARRDSNSACRGPSPRRSCLTCLAIAPWARSRRCGARRRQIESRAHRVQGRRALASDFVLSWRQGQGPVAEVPAVLEATGGLVARIDGRSANTQAQLTVRSFGGEFDSFRVRLPPGAILWEATTPTTRVRGRAAAGGCQGRGGRQGRRDPSRSKTTGPVHVRLATEQTYEVVKQKQGLQLGGFEVLGAVRQWGHLAVQVVGEWQIHWVRN